MTGWKNLAETHNPARLAPIEGFYVPVGLALTTGPTNAGHPAWRTSPEESIHG